MGGEILRKYRTTAAHGMRSAVDQWAHPQASPTLLTTNSGELVYCSLGLRYLLSSPRAARIAFLRFQLRTGASSVSH